VVEGTWLSERTWTWLIFGVLLFLGHFDRGKRDLYLMMECWMLIIVELWC